MFHEKKWNNADRYRVENASGMIGNDERKNR